MNKLLIDIKNNYPTFDITPQFAPSNYLLLVFL